MQNSHIVSGIFDIHNIGIHLHGSLVAPPSMTLGKAWPDVTVVSAPLLKDLLPWELWAGLLVTPILDSV